MHLVHEGDHLKDKLVLAQVVADLVDGRIFGPGRVEVGECLENELARHEVTLEHCRLVHVDADDAHARVNDERYGVIEVEQIKRRLGRFGEERAQLYHLLVACDVLATRCAHHIVQALEELLLADYVLVDRSGE